MSGDPEEWEQSLLYIQTMIDTWTCHACGNERPDERINVYSFPLKDLPGAEINFRYCNDRPPCLEAAFKAAHDEQNKNEK